MYLTLLVQVLVEKLLRTTNVKRLYLLIRPKRGAPTTARLQELLASKLFHKYVATAFTYFRNNVL